MKTPRFTRYALSSCAAAAMLAGCGASQPPISATSVVPRSRASTGYKSLHSFGKRFSDGLEPKAALIEVSGTLYGTTVAGGSTACTGGCGTVFAITSSGEETTLYRFGGGTDGANPSTSLLAVRSVLYGTTEKGGGEANLGTVFKISTTGVENVLHGFRGGFYHGRYYNDGAHPVASLIDVKGKLYGTTFNGGSGGDGTVFRISTSGREKVLHSFALDGDGANPVANLTDVKGNLYGTTQLGGAPSSQGYGTVFSVSTTGTEKVIFTFPYGPYGAFPAAGLIDVNGTLYGTTTESGGHHGGTAFSITTSGSLTILHSFGSRSDGSNPWAPLLDVRGTLYGTTAGGGAYARGTVFSMSLTGSEKVLHSFGHGSDGATPLAGLVDVNGTLYGTTSAGGKHGKGTVFALTP